jgi:acetyl esterase/lipase
MRPGYAQIGRPNDTQGYNWELYKNNIGSLVTPKLQQGTLDLSFKAMILRDPTLGRSGGTSFKQEASGTMLYDAIIVNVKGGGIFNDGTTSKTISGVSYTQFENYELTILNATAETQVEFTSPKSDVAEDNNTTWFIDDICVMKDGADTDVARTIQVANPNLKIALPKKSASNGKLVIMVPGGGYSGMNLVGDREGEGWAPYYNERGIACATLRYTLPAGNCLLPVNDLKNAIKYIRDHATELGVSEIGVHGFSAGGHLASTGATHFTGELRPDFQILFYPVITLRNATHNGSRNQFLGTNPSQYMLDLYSNELQVTKDTPKAFVMYYVPDTVVPQATNGAAYVEALKAKNVPVKTLIYDTCYPDSDTQNGHGWWERDTRIDGKHVKEHLADWLKTL